MENFALTALIEELREHTQGMVVRRIIQHHRNGFLLHTRSPRVPPLKLSLDPRRPVIYLSSARPPVQPAGTEFLMLLRKHLIGSRLLELKKPLSERIVELAFKTALPAKELEIVYLVAELLPNAPNLLLLDRARRVLGSLRAPHPRRGIEAYNEYSYPSSDKTTLDVACRDDTSWFDEVQFSQNPKNWLIRNVAGLGPILAAEILQRHSASGRSIPEQIRATIARLLEPSATAWIYTVKPLSFILERNDIDALRKAILSPMELDFLGPSYSAQTRPGMLEATRIVSDELESRVLLGEAKAPRIRQIRDRMRRLNQQEQRLLHRQQQYSDAGEIQTRAQMLVASGSDMEHHYEAIDVTDYFGENPRSRRISLDESITLRENINKMFKQCRKAGRGMAKLRNQLVNVKTEQTKLQEETERLATIGSWEKWAALTPPQRVRKSTPKTRIPPPSERQRHRSIRLDGHEVLVGRSGRENDELTFKVANGDDFWLHVAGYTGSHVIVRNPERANELEDSILLRAAQLAAYYSQARNSSKVEVHYTRRKFVSKPRKAKPGLVELREFKTVTVEPHNWIEATSAGSTASTNGH